MNRKIKWLLLINAVMGCAIYHRTQVKANVPAYHSAENLNDVSQSNQFSWGPLMECIKLQRLSPKQIDEFQAAFVDATLRDDRSEVAWQKNFENKLQVMHDLKQNNFTEKDLKDYMDKLSIYYNDSKKANFGMIPVISMLSFRDNSQERWKLYQKFMSNPEPIEAIKNGLEDLKLANESPVDAIKRRDYLSSITKRLNELNTVDSLGYDSEILGLKTLEKQLSEYINNHQWKNATDKSDSSTDNHSNNDHSSADKQENPDQQDAQNQPDHHQVDPQGRDAESDSKSADDKEPIKPQPNPHPVPEPIPQPKPESLPDTRSHQVYIDWLSVERFLKNDFDHYYINGTGIHYLADADDQRDLSDCNLKTVDQFALNQEDQWQDCRIKRMPLKANPQFLILKRGLRLHSSLVFSNKVHGGLIKRGTNVKALKKFQLINSQGKVYWRYKIRLNQHSYLISSYPKYFR